MIMIVHEVTNAHKREWRDAACTAKIGRIANADCVVEDSPVLDLLSKCGHCLVSMNHLHRWIDDVRVAACQCVHAILEPIIQI